MKYPYVVYEDDRMRVVKRDQETICLEGIRSDSMGCKYYLYLHQFVFRSQLPIFDGNKQECSTKSYISSCRCWKWRKRQLNN